MIIFAIMIVDSGYYRDSITFIIVFMIVNIIVMMNIIMIVLR